MAVASVWLNGLGQWAKIRGGIGERGGGGEGVCMTFWKNNGWIINYFGNGVC